MSDKECDHCLHIREVAEMIIQWTLQNWQMKDIGQLAAYFHARIRHESVKEGDEILFLEWFNQMCDYEFQRYSLEHPIEPKQFDEKFDFRQCMKG